MSITANDAKYRIDHNSKTQQFEISNSRIIANENLQFLIQSLSPQKKILNCSILFSVKMY